MITVNVNLMKFAYILKELIAFLIRFSGMSWFIREFLFRKKITIIVYHDPTPEALKCHLVYLSRHYTFITLADAVKALRTKDFSGVPPKSLVITIDDGHAGNFVLLKLFRQYRVRPTIYLSSHIVDSCRHFWTKEVGGSVHYYNQFGHQHFLKCMEKNFRFYPDKEYDDRQALNLQEIMAMNPWVDFQCHGRYHFNLIRCDNDTVLKEIKGSKNKIENMIKRPCDHFAYPFGDYTVREMEYVRESMLISGRTADPGWNDAHTNPYSLKVAAMIPDNASENMLCAQLSGLPNYVACLGNKLFR